MTPTRYTIHGNHDGDTLYADVQLLGTLWLIGEKIRVAGVNCPEIPSAEGVAAQLFTADWMRNHKYTLDLKPNRDKYGRLLGDLICGEERLSSALLACGHAVAYRELEE